MACPPTLTKDGFEMQYGANHLGHFLFTNLVLDSLKAAGQARIVVVSALAHEHSPVQFDVAGSLDIYKRAGYIIPGLWVAYAQSKTANILFASELQRRLIKEGNDAIKVVSLHPGIIKTELTRHLIDSVLFKAFSWTTSFFMLHKTMGQGAATQVFAAVAPEIDQLPGAYLDDCKPARLADYAKSEENAKKLWELSEQQVKLPEALKEVKASS